MKTVERISGTFVRHNWKTITQGLAEGKTFVVENHGRPEAIVTAPKKNVNPARAKFDLDNYFARLRRQPPITLADINAGLARSPK